MIMKLLVLTAVMSICLTGTAIGGESHRKDHRATTRGYGHDIYEPRTNAEKRDDGDVWYCGNIPTPGCERPTRREKPRHCDLNPATPMCRGE
jgi:hypothetical protein